MITMLYASIYQKRLPVELRFNSQEVRAERMLRHLEISLPCPPDQVERRVDEILVGLSKYSSLSASSRIASILLALIGLMVSGLGLLESLIVLALVVILVGGAAVLYLYSKYEEKHSGGAYPEYYYREKMKGWLIDAARIASTRVAGSRGRAIIGGLIYDYFIERRRSRVYLRLHPV